MNEKPKTATCQELNDLLDLLAADDLPEEQAGGLTAHVESCPACRAAFERRRKLTAELRGELTSTTAQTGFADVWPAVRDQLAQRERRQWWLRWLQLEPVRALAAAAVLTVGLYLLMVSYPPHEPMAQADYPVYESVPVVVATARIDHQSARVSGFESGDGSTVFLWLEGVQ